MVEENMPLDRVKSSKLLHEMRVIGLEINSHMNRVIGENHKQFLIASAITRREIETETFQILLKDIRSHFLRLLNGANGIYGRSRFLKFRRVVFLMNSKDSTGKKYHTEARLLDPTGKILENIKSRNEINLSEADLDHDQGFLACLKNDFRKEFGMFEDCIIAMFSFFLPCTQNDHMCSMLIGKYAEISKTGLIVSYEMPFRTTDKELSLCLMNSDNVLIIHPENYTFQVSSSFPAHIIVQVYIAILFQTILKLFQTIFKSNYMNGQRMQPLMKQYVSPEMEYLPANACYLGGNTTRHVTFTQERQLHMPNERSHGQITEQNLQNLRTDRPISNNYHVQTVNIQSLQGCHSCIPKRFQCFQSCNSLKQNGNQYSQLEYMYEQDGNQGIKKYNPGTITGITQGYQISIPSTTDRNQYFQRHDPRFQYMQRYDGNQYLQKYDGNQYLQRHDPRLCTGNQISIPCTIDGNQCFHRSDGNQYWQRRDPRLSTGNQGNQISIPCTIDGNQYFQRHGGNQYMQGHDPRLSTGNRGNQISIPCTTDGNQYFQRLDGNQYLQGHDPRLSAGNRGNQISIPCTTDGNQYLQRHDPRLPTGYHGHQISIPCTTDGNHYLQRHDPRLFTGNQGNQ